MNRQISIKRIFDNKTISAGSSIESEIIDLNLMNPIGNFGFQIAVTGTGILKGEILLSNDGLNFVKPTSSVEIFSDFTSSSGSDGDGKDIFFADVRIPARWMKIKVTETGGLNSATITADLSMQ